MRCSLCGRPVLGLEGQDWNVLPWMLAPEVREDEVLPGACHVRCLHDRGVGRLWAEAVQDYYCLRWPQWRTGRTAGIRWRLHGSPPARRFHLWRADGRLSSFPYEAVAAGGPLVELTAEVGEVGSDHATVLLAAMGTTESGVPVPLHEVIEALGVTDRYPDAEGWLTRRLRGGRPGVADILVARYRLVLDESCRRAARDLIRGSV